jgi:hypothetical protein
MNKDTAILKQNKKGKYVKGQVNANANDEL